MAERFDARTWQIVTRSEGHARRLRHDSVAPGHLLLALVDTDPHGTDTEIAGLIGIPAARIRDAVTTALGPGSTEHAHVPYSAETQSVLGLALQEATDCGVATVKPEHLLLALLSQGNATVMAVLREHGVDPDRPRKRLGPPTPLPSPAPSPGALASVTRDLAADPRPVIGRDAEVERVLRTLTRHRRNVPLLIGEPGIGKESIVRGAARAIAAGRVPTALRNRTVRALDLAAVLADPRHRARGSTLIAELLGEAGRDTTLVLHLNRALTPLHLPEGTTTPLGLFRSLLGAPGVLVLGDCDRVEYERRDPDSGLDDLVQPLAVEEPPADDVLEILRAVRRRLEHHHTVALTEAALEAAARLTRDHVPDQPQPGSAIGLLDEAAALARTRAARSDAPAEQPLDIGELDVVRALAAYSGIRAPAPVRPAARRPAVPAEHDPSVWSMS